MSIGRALGRARTKFSSLRESPQFGPVLEPQGADKHAHPGNGGLSVDLDQSRLNQEIENALIANRLRLHYQPIVCLDTYVAHEFEALLRWDHRDRGLLLPGDFLFALESDDLQRAIGRWVLAEACAQGRIWQDQQPGRRLTMAVNLSSSQIRDPRMLEDVKRILDETGFDPASLRIEINEAITLDEIGAAVSLIEGLKHLGIGLALDDFGAGNSGWTLLRQSQIDVIKLDRSFIAPGRERNSENLRMIEALADFARRLGMLISIEGVERAEQATKMRSIGVQLAQGFYFSKPQPAARVAPMLANVPLRPIA